LAINVIVEEKIVRQVDSELKAARAEGIVEYPLNKIVALMRILALTKSSAVKLLAAGDGSCRRPCGRAH